MPKIWKGKPVPSGGSIAVVVARFNEEVTGKLLEGALSALRGSGVADTSVEVVHVPGAFEIPVTAKRMAMSGRFAAVVCLGAVIKGETPHWDYLSSAVAHTLALASTETGVPFAFGVLTTETEEAALARACESDNRGRDAALAALEMASLFREMP